MTTLTDAKAMAKAMSLIDTHCHLDFTDFDMDRNEVIDSCSNVGVNTIVVPATQQSTWQRTLDLPFSAKTSDSVQQVALYVALGLHPVFNDAHQPQHLLELEQLVIEHSPIAVGEIGLDFHTSMNLSSAQKDKQLAYFEKQFVIANTHQLPVIIHNRKAHDECIKIIKSFYDNGYRKGGIIHAFNGSIQQAEHYRALGFSLGFGGMLTYPRSSKLQALVKAIPIDNIVLETDAPDMTVMAQRGQRNSPAYLPDVARAVALYKSLDVAEIAKHTTRNAQTVFGLSSP
jgi:TatD DNase family protein